MCAISRKCFLCIMSSSYNKVDAFFSLFSTQLSSPLFVCFTICLFVILFVFSSRSIPTLPMITIVDILHQLRISDNVKRTSETNGNHREIYPWYESVKRKGINLKSNPAPVRPQDFSRLEIQSAQSGDSRSSGNKVCITVLILDGHSE